MVVTTFLAQGCDDVFCQFTGTSLPKLGDELIPRDRKVILKK